MQQPSPSEETSALLARLANRPEVQSTLILARDNGAIVRSSGLVTVEDETEPPSAPPAVQVNGTADGESKRKNGTRKAEEIARLVWAFMQGCGQLVEGMNGDGDELKLLRLRTKKNELVIVPDARFLLVVVHATPPA